MLVKHFMWTPPSKLPWSWGSVALRSSCTPSFLARCCVLWPEVLMWPQIASCWLRFTTCSWLPSVVHSTIQRRSRGRRRGGRGGVFQQLAKMLHWPPAVVLRSLLCDVPGSSNSFPPCSSHDIGPLSSIFGEWHQAPLNGHLSRYFKPCLLSFHFI